MQPFTQTENSSGYRAESGVRAFYFDGTQQKVTCKIVFQS